MPELLQQLKMSEKGLVELIDDELSRTDLDDKVRTFRINPIKVPYGDEILTRYDVETHIEPRYTGGGEPLAEPPPAEVAPLAPEIGDAEGGKKS